MRILSAAGAPAAAAREIIVLSLLQAPCLSGKAGWPIFKRQEEKWGLDEMIWGGGTENLAPGL